VKKALTLLVVSLVMAGLLVGCGGSSDGGAAEPAEAALKITGSVAAEKSWTEAELQAMDAVEAEYTGKDGVAMTYSGPALSALLGEADVADGATALVLVAADDYSAEVALADLEGCDTCIVALQDGGGLRSVLPDMSGKVQVKDLIEIQVK
jgi:hypothetical protein